MPNTPTMPTLHTVRGHRARLITVVTAALLVLGLLALPALAHVGNHPSHDTDRHAPALSRSAPGVGAQLAQVRAATARYHDVEVALADGYVLPPGSPCVEGPEGAMGYHFVNLGRLGQLLADDTLALNPTAPEALLYIPGPDGQLRLVGVEYLHPRGGELFGQPLADFSPPFGEETALHVWLWQANPAGMFAAYNPNLSCPAG